MKLVPCPECGHKNNPSLGRKIKYRHKVENDSMLLVCRGKGCNYVLTLTLDQGNYLLNKRKRVSS